MKLSVYKKNILVGYLSFDGKVYSFVYDPNYLSNTDAEPVSPKIPLTDKIEYSQKLFNVFEQLIPEGRDRKILEKKANSANDFDLLPWLQHVYGDLQFSRTNLQDFYKVDYADVKNEILQTNSFPNILNMEIQIDDKALFPEQTDIYDIANKFTPSGLSGFQHKLSVILDNNIIRQPEFNELSEYFIKPYSLYKANPEYETYLPHLAINEHLFMTFAKNELSFDVPWSGIVKSQSDKEFHYIVKRFDRYQGYKFSHDEFATLMGLDSETKYQTSSENMFKQIKKYLTLPEERLILLKYYFYSMLIVHEDMHTKNLSVRTEGKNIRMSPLYDIATTGIYQNTYGYETHLPINGKRTNIRLKDFYVLVDLLDVDRNSFNQAAADILWKYTNKLPMYFEKLASMFPDTMIYKKSRIKFYGQKSRITKSMSLAEAMIKSHQNRMKQLEKNGWYEQLNCSYNYTHQ
jgi:serine/threonine-protein kinase HipA